MSGKDKRLFFLDNQEPMTPESYFIAGVMFLASWYVFLVKVYWSE